MSRPLRKDRRARRRRSALDRHFNQAARGFVRVAASCGYTSRDIETAIKRESRKTPKSWAREVREPVPAMDAAADVLELWFSNTRYLDSSANPRPLPLSGDTASLESLSLEVAPQIPVKDVLRHVLRPTVLRQTKAGYVPCDRVLSFRGAGSPAHARNLRIMNAMLATLVHNGKPQRSTPGWVELQVVHQRVPARQLPVLGQHVRGTGKAFLVETETRFRKSEREARPTEPRKLVGVGIYWFEEPPLPDGRRRKRRTG